MLGESTPRYIGVLDKTPKPPSKPNSNLVNGQGLCMAVSGGGSEWNGQGVCLWDCGSGAGNDDKMWTFTADGLLRNAAGKCLSLPGHNRSAAATDDELPLVVWDCAAGNPLQQWHLDASTGALINKAAGGGGGRGAVDNAAVCVAMKGGGTTHGTLLVAVAATEPSPSCANWTDGTPTPDCDGECIWETWFVPYFELISRPSVKAFCYIDWYWAKYTSFDWGNWGDCRIEMSTMVRGQMGAELGRAAADRFVHGGSRAQVCTALGC